MGSSPASAGTGTPFLIGGPERMFRVSPVTTVGDVFHASMATGSWTAGPDGQPCAGSVGVLADVALGYPVVAVAADGRWAISIELTLDFCAPVPQNGQPLRSESTVVALSPSGGVTQARFTGADGTLVALGKQRMWFTSYDRSQLTGEEAGTWRARPDAAAAPGTRAPDAGPADGARPDGARPDGALPDGALPDGALREADTLGQLGASLTRTPGGAILALPGSGTVVNPMGNLHGGIMFCASELAGHAAVQSEEHPLITASVTVTYLRPGPATGQTVFEASTVYRGRTLAVAQVTSRNAAGKICTLATVTSHRGD
jgi:uncharacterized protein (TIGR00369 family)